MYNRKILEHIRATNRVIRVTNMLQAESIDLYSVKKHVENLIQIFENHKNDSNVFLEILERVKQLALKFHIDLGMLK